MSETGGPETQSLLNRLRRYGSHLSSTEYRQFFRDVAVYAGGGMLIRSVSFLTVPIVARTMSQQEFAVLDVIAALQALGGVLIGLNLDTSLARYYYEYRNEADRKRLVASLISTVALLGAVAVVCVSLASSRLSVLLFQSNAYAAALAYSSVGIPIGAVGIMGLSVIRFDKKPVEFALVSFAGAVIQFGLVIAVLEKYGADVSRVVLAQVAGQAVVLAMVTVRNRRIVALMFDRTVLRRSLGFSLPQYPSVFISWYLNSANRFFMISLGSLTVVSTFAVASKVNGVLLGFMAAFANAWLPFATSIMHSEGAKRVYANIMYVIVILLSALTVVSVLVVPAFLRLYAGPMYAGAAFPATVLIMATCIGSGFGWFLAIGLYLREKSVYFTIAQVGTFVANTTLNVLLIPLWGADGAALAVLAGSFVQVVLLAYFSNRVYPLPHRKEIWLFPAFAFGVILVAKLIVGP